MKIRHIILEDQNSAIGQLIADIRAGIIKPQIVQAVKNYMFKKLSSESPASKDVDSNLPKSPVNSTKNATQKNKDQQPNAQPSVAGPLSNTTNTEPPSVTENSDLVDVDIDQDFEKILRTKFANDAENILTFVYRTNLQQVCSEIVANKMFKPEAAPLLFTLFYEAPGTFHERNTIAITIRDNGILNLTTVTAPGEGSVYDFLGSKYKKSKLAVYLMDALLNRKDFPTQVSSATKGAGEDMLSILGNPVLKLSPGDLNVAGKEVEVKAQGARLKGFGGGRIYGDGTKIYDRWASDIATALGAKGMNYMVSQGVSLKKYLNFGLANLTVLADALAQGNGKNKKAIVKNAFDLLLAHVYPLSTAEMRSKVTGTIQTNGGFDVTQFRQAWFLFSYHYYKLSTEDKKSSKAMDIIMFIHQPSKTYYNVVSDENFDFSKFTIDSNLYNWTDAPSVAPKITYGKEIRSKRVIPK